MIAPSPSSVLVPSPSNVTLHVPSPSPFAPAPSPGTLGVHMPSPAAFISPQGSVEYVSVKVTHFICTKAYTNFAF